MAWVIGNLVAAAVALLLSFLRRRRRHAEELAWLEGQAEGAASRAPVAAAPSAETEGEDAEESPEVRTSRRGHRVTGRVPRQRRRHEAPVSSEPAAESGGGVSSMA